MYFLLEVGDFHGYVRLPESTLLLMSCTCQVLQIHSLSTIHQVRFGSIGHVSNLGFLNMTCVHLSHAPSCSNMLQKDAIFIERILWTGCQIWQGLVSIKRGLFFGHPLWNWLGIDWMSRSNSCSTSFVFLVLQGGMLRLSLEFLWRTCVGISTFNWKTDVWCFGKQHWIWLWDGNDGNLKIRDTAKLLCEA